MSDYLRCLRDNVREEVENRYQYPRSTTWDQVDKNKYNNDSKEINVILGGLVELEFEGDAV